MYMYNKLMTQSYGLRKSRVRATGMTRVANCLLE